MAETTVETTVKQCVEHCRAHNIIIPTFAQLKEPSTVPVQVRERLAQTGMNDLDPINLFRIGWKNEPVERGGGFNQGNWLEFPAELTGVPARIIGLVGKHFPTGCHKVGAAFGCLAPRLVSGEFDPTRHKAVWPSTGNFCRGGAFVTSLLSCGAVAILPEEMSVERFEWLRSIGAEIITTAGGESNVKAIYDECWNIRGTRPECVIFNQFAEFGNAMWHYQVTGSVVEEIFEQLADPHDRLAAFVSATGSAGTVAAGDYLRTVHPNIKVAVAEALQCPTLLQCGFGAHRIEGIGDKHVPWIHNVRNTDIVAAVDDEQCFALMRLFNEPRGREFMARQGVPDQLLAQFNLLGISSICNLVTAIKVAKFYELDSHDLVFTPLTDSMELYGSRVEEQRATAGVYTKGVAAADYARYLCGIGIDHMRELGYYDRKALHNLKYFTWVEQQGRTEDELRRLWDPDFWQTTFALAEEWDRHIAEFNGLVGLL